MSKWAAILIAAWALAACGKKAESDKSAPDTSAESDTSAEPDTSPPLPPPASDCQVEEGDNMFQAWKAALRDYQALEFPPAEADCEALRVFTVGVGPVAQAFYGNMQGFQQWSQARSDACRAQSKEKYGGEMAALMADLEKELGPAVTDWEQRVRACKDHPGMAEAFDAASFQAAR